MECPTAHSGVQKSKGRDDLADDSSVASALFTTRRNSIDGSLRLFLEFAYIALREAVSWIGDAVEDAFSLQSGKCKEMTG